MPPALFKFQAPKRLFIAKPEMLYPEATVLKPPRSQEAATLHKAEQDAFSGFAPILQFE
jgi:hypothetical protein